MKELSGDICGTLAEQKLDDRGHLRRVSESLHGQPTLEAMDRVNAVSLAVGFPLLTLGLTTGVFWLRAAEGVAWLGSSHEAWTVVAWGVYAGLVTARFIGHQGGRQAAASAVAGFAFLLFAVVGVGVLA